MRKREACLFVLVAASVILFGTSCEGTLAWFRGPNAPSDSTTPPVPIFSPSPGIYPSTLQVAISTDSVTVDSIHYTLDGSDPMTGDWSACSPGDSVSIAGTATITAVSFVGSRHSDTATGSYTLLSSSDLVGLVGLEPAPAPTFSPPGGVYTSDRSVEISSTIPNAIIYYGMNGSVQTAGLTMYTGEITASVAGSGTTIEAIVYTPASGISARGVANYITRSYSVGDTGPAGGFIFYDKGSVSSGWRFLEAAPSDQSAGIRWNNGNYIRISTSIAIGTGKSNTAAIIAAQGSGSYAASLCKNLSLGGYSDWFLPSKDELNLLYTNLILEGLGGFWNIVYWSSSMGYDEYWLANAWSLGILNAPGMEHLGLNGTDYYCSVRAVRAF